MKIIETSIRIEAAASVIWDILMDFENYPNWNPFITYISGAQEIHGKLKVHIQPPASKAMTFTPVVIKHLPNQIFSWKGKLGIQGLFDGTHTFELKSNENDVTTFIHRESFTGILVSFINLHATKKGFESMNAALKKLAESIS